MLSKPLLARAAKTLKLRVDWSLKLVLDIRADFMKASIINSCRFFMAWVAIALLISLVNDFSNHTLLLKLIDRWQYIVGFPKKFSRHSSFSEFHFVYSCYKCINFCLWKLFYVTKCNFSYLLHFVNIGYTNIKFLKCLMKYLFMSNISLNMSVEN